MKMNFAYSKRAGDSYSSRGVDERLREAAKEFNAAETKTCKILTKEESGNKLFIKERDVKELGYVKQLTNLEKEVTKRAREPRSIPKAQNDEKFIK